MTFRVRSDRAHIRTGYRSNRFLLAEITAPPSVRERGRPPVNLAFVLDRSGSMSGEKLGLARRAVEDAIGRLKPDDRFSVVVYDDRVDVVSPSALATPEARRIVMARLGEIEARANTNLGEGWLRGCEQVAAALSEQGVNRCLLLTDGLANEGITDREELALHAGELRARGVTTSSFGVGNDFDELLLQSMASAGGGHFYYIAGPAAIPDLISSEVGEALDVVARDVRLTLRVREDVEVEALSPYPWQQVRDASAGRSVATLQIGDLVANEQVAAVLRLRFPLGEIGAEMAAELVVADRDAAVDGGAEPVRLAWTYADDRTNDLQPRDREVDRAVARVYAARARQDAVRLNRRGDFGAARARLEATARRIRGYAGSDAELVALAEGLASDTIAMAAPAPEMLRKSMFAGASYSLRARTAEGRAFRARPDEDA